MTTPGETSPFAALLRFELSQAVRLRHAVALAAMAAIGFVLAFWLPMFPETVFRFFQRAFQLGSWAEIVVANVLAGLFFFVYWVAVFDVVAIYVVPLEEQRLDLYLSKPLSRRAYLLARFVPVLLTAIGLYTLSVAASWWALGLARLSYPPEAFLGAAAVMLSWTLLAVAIVNLAALWARESYVALLFAFVPMMVSLLPSMVYMYRPDVFLTAGGVRDLIVFPLNLVWHQDFATSWGPWIAALLLAMAVAVAGASGWLIERRDVV